jgi:hypothetical protein
MLFRAVGGFQEWVDGWAEGWMDGWAEGWVGGGMGGWVGGGMGGWVGGGMGGWVGLRVGFINIKCAAYVVAQGRGWRYGFININDMYNNDVGKGGAQGCEAYEVK